MPQQFDRPKDDGKIKLPRIDGAMNKIAPDLDLEDNRSKKKKRPSKNLPILSASGSGKEDEPEASPKVVQSPQEQAEDIEKKKAEEILGRARKRFDKAIQAESGNRRDGLEDLKFLVGEQWPADVVAQRNFDKRPCLTINKMKTFVHQITNDLRQNRPAINVSPVGDKGDREVAKMYRGLIREIERASMAELAYDTAAFNAVANGLGYWRTTTEYDEAVSFNQVIRVKRIRNPFTVYLDPDHQEPDGSDSKWGFVAEMIPRHEFEDLYPDNDPMAWTQGAVGEGLKNWITQETIRIAEYFEIGHESRTLVMLSNGHVGWEDELSEDVLEHIKSGTLEIVNKRESEEQKCTWYKLTAKEILEKQPWPGKWIPIVKVIGDEIDVEGKVKLSGIVRDAKDAQRMVNFWEPVSIDTPLPTPAGWTTMGEVEAGDQLLNEKGQPCSVLGVSPIHLHRECYRVSFDDGTSIVADATHPWQVEERGKRTEIGDNWHSAEVCTKDLIPRAHFIYLAAPLNLPKADLPIDPYLLGVWLGDGNTANPQITAGDQDIRALRENLQAIGCSLGPIRRHGTRAGVFTVLGVIELFRGHGLLGRKHIPVAYLRASREQRLALLQGLMDTDGSVGQSNRLCSFSTTLPAISDGFAELLRTLGIKASRMRRAARWGASGGTTYLGSPIDQFSFSCGDDDDVFRLERKRAIQHRKCKINRRRTKRYKIVSVERVPSVPVKCVAVNTPSHLFLAGEGMVPTHNTAFTELVALAPKAPFIGAEGQFEGHEAQWKQANTRSFPYLQYKPETLAGKPLPPPQRQPLAGVPQGIQQGIQNASQNMMATTGIRFDATAQERTIDESGRAIRELRRTGDVGSFHYVDNFARSLRHQGNIFLDLIPKIYDTKRIVTILREDDTEEMVQLDPSQQKPFQQTRNPQTEKVQKIFNPTYGKYGVTVTIGPGFATKRIEASESMMAFAKAVPQVAQFIPDLIADAMDWPGSEKIATRLAKVVAMQAPGVMSPDMQDVSPQIQAMLTSMQEQIKKMTEERATLMKALTDQTQDRQVKVEGINKVFEAKMAALEEKLMEANIKAKADRDSDMRQVSQKAAEHFMDLVEERHKSQQEALPQGARMAKDGKIYVPLPQGGWGQVQ